ncbi:uncharacterized protein LOC119700376 [Motacilla alba alba]|uniref:uncharacterized protein LOC119700376 n=1 Tax=Motacilla alba alba TaxID=1094192 RepID=UPI0018D574FB|nr:uncharacterized protein LOC119700376 [Motacilla alba alba]
MKKTSSHRGGVWGRSPVGMGAFPTFLGHLCKKLWLDSGWDNAHNPYLDSALGKSCSSPAALEPRLESQTGKRRGIFAASISICAGTQRWTVSYSDGRGSCVPPGTLAGRLGSVASPEAPVERVDKAQLRSGSSGREPEQEQPSGEGAECGTGSVEPFPARRPPGSGMRGRDPRGARGHTALCRRDGTGGTGAVPAATALV